MQLWMSMNFRPFCLSFLHAGATDLQRKCGLVWRHTPATLALRGSPDRRMGQEFKVLALRTSTHPHCTHLPSRSKKNFGCMPPTPNLRTEEWRLGGCRGRSQSRPLHVWVCVRTGVGSAVHVGSGISGSDQRPDSPPALSPSCHSALLATQLPAASSLPHPSSSHRSVSVPVWRLDHAISSVH